MRGLRLASGVCARFWRTWPIVRLRSGFGCGRAMVASDCCSRLIRTRGLVRMGRTPRNWRSLHEVQFLTSRYLQMPDDFSPRGFDAWTATWLWKFGDVYRTLWQLNSGAIPMNVFPPQAFDTPDERARTVARQIPRDTPIDRTQAECGHQRTQKQKCKPDTHAQRLARRQWGVVGETRHPTAVCPT